MPTRNNLQHVRIYNQICRYLPTTYSGTFVEVGAADPVDISVSFLFRQLSEQKRMHSFRQAHEWKGMHPSGQWDIICVEPNPNFCAEFRKMGLSILEYAACAEDKGKTTFNISPYPMSSSALEVRIGCVDKDWQPTIEVEALTLNTILARHHPELTHVDVLLADVEGWELEVMRGFDLKKFAPKVVVLENISNLPSYHSFMAEAGYKLDKRVYIDEFYITPEVEAFVQERQKKRRGIT